LDAKTNLHHAGRISAILTDKLDGKTRFTVERDSGPPLTLPRSHIFSDFDETFFDCDLFEEEER